MSLQDGWHALAISEIKSRFDFYNQDNSKLSLRGFAKMAYVSPSTMSEILSGCSQWELSPDRALQILRNVGADQKVINRVAALNGVPPTIEIQNFNDKDYDFLVDGISAPLLLVYELPVVPDRAELAKKLNVSEEAIESTTQKLLQKGLLAKTPSGQIYRDQEVHFTTSDNIPSEVLRLHQEMNLERMKVGLHTIPVDKRDITSMTFTGNSSQLSEIRAEIRKFHQRIFALMDHDTNKDEVYTLCVGFVPYEFSESKDNK